MKESPFTSLPVFLRVTAKALILVVVFNFALLATGWNPIRSLTTVNTWGLTGEGRARLVYPSDFQNGQLPLESLLAAHQLAYTEKTDGEYRVLLLGESGVAGWGVRDEDTLAAQLTALGIQVEGKKLAAYNLAYPQPSVARDLLILDAAMAYQPDLVIWFLTPSSLDNAPDIVGSNRVFFDLNRVRFEALIDRYEPLLGEWYAGHGPQLLTPEPAWQEYVAIRDQELLPIWINTLFYPFIDPDLAVSDRRIGSESIPEEARYTDDHPGFETMPNETWQFLRAGCQHTLEGGAQMLVVNEPMVIGSGPNSDVNYNMQYEQALYDRYHDVLGEFVAEYGIRYADLWEVIPAERFTDTPLHTDAEGFAILAAALEEVLTGDFQVSECR
jgi:hypothetical protein